MALMVSSNMDAKVCVAVRVRPLIERETLAGGGSHWSADQNVIQQVGPDLGFANTLPYVFDHVFDMPSRTSQVYEKIVAPVVRESLNGFNGTILCYGQTSSGKTFTLYGNDTEEGIISLAAQDLFKQISKDQTRTYLIRVGLVEIYNEKVSDLLNSNKPVEIKEINGIVIPKDLEEIEIEKPEDLLAAAKRVQQQRRIGETQMNKESSRSHTILRIFIESAPRRMDISDSGETNEVQVTNALLNFVDLAGSEKAGQTGAVGERFKEATFINKSLSVLSLVVNQLSVDSGNATGGQGQSTPAVNASLLMSSTSKPKKFASFRDSKLTRILQSSLSGNAYIVMICNVTPSSIDETHSTLRFAKTAKKIKTEPKANLVVTDSAKYQQKIKELQSQLVRVEQELGGKSSEVAELKQRLEIYTNFWPTKRAMNSSDALTIPQTEAKRRRTWCPSQLKQIREGKEVLSPVQDKLVPHPIPITPQSSTRVLRTHTRASCSPQKSQGTTESFMSYDETLQEFQKLSDQRKQDSWLEAEGLLSPDELLTLKRDAGVQTDEARNEFPLVSSAKRKRRDDSGTPETPAGAAKRVREALTSALELDKIEWQTEKLFMEEELAEKTKRILELEAILDDLQNLSAIRTLGEELQGVLAEEIRGINTLPTVQTVDSETQYDPSVTCFVQTQTDLLGVSQGSQTLPGAQIIDSETQTDPSVTCRVQTQTDLSGVNQGSQTPVEEPLTVSTVERIDSFTMTCASIEDESKPDPVITVFAQTQTDLLGVSQWSQTLPGAKTVDSETQSDASATCIVQTQTDLFGGVSQESQTLPGAKTVDSETQSDPSATCLVQTQTDLLGVSQGSQTLPGAKTVDSETQLDASVTCVVQTQTYLFGGVSQESQTLPGAKTVDSETQSDPSATCLVQTQTDLLGVSQECQTIPGANSVDSETQSDPSATCLVQTQTDLAQPDPSVTCVVQTQTDLLGGVSQESQTLPGAKTVDSETQSDISATCLVQTQTDLLGVSQASQTLPGAKTVDTEMQSDISVTCLVQTQTDLAQPDPSVTCVVQTQTDLLGGVSQESQTLPGAKTVDSETQSDISATCLVQTQTDLLGVSQASQTLPGAKTVDTEMQSDISVTCLVQTQTDLAQPDPSVTCVVQTQTDLLGGVSQESQTLPGAKTVDSETQSDISATCLVQTQTDLLGVSQASQTLPGAKTVDTEMQSDISVTCLVQTQTDLLGLSQESQTLPGAKTVDSEMQSDPTATCLVQTQTDLTQPDPSVTFVVQTQTDLLEGVSQESQTLPGAKTVDSEMQSDISVTCLVQTQTDLLGVSQGSQTLPGAQTVDSETQPDPSVTCIVQTQTDLLGVSQGSQTLPGAQTVDSETQPDPSVTCVVQTQTDLLEGVSQESQTLPGAKTVDSEMQSDPCVTCIVQTQTDLLGVSQESQTLPGAKTVDSETQPDPSVTCLVQTQTDLLGVSEGSQTLPGAQTVDSETQPDPSVTCIVQTQTDLLGVSQGSQTPTEEPLTAERVDSFTMTCASTENESKPDPAITSFAQTQTDRVGISRGSQTLEETDLKANLRSMQIMVKIRERELLNLKDTAKLEDISNRNRIKELESKLANNYSEVVALKDKIEVLSSVSGTKRKADIEIQCDYIIEQANRAATGERGLLPKGFPDLAVMTREVKRLRDYNFILDIENKKCTCRGRTRNPNLLANPLEKERSLNTSEPRNLESLRNPVTSSNSGSLPPFVGRIFRSNAIVNTGEASGSSNNKPINNRPMQSAMPELPLESRSNSVTPILSSTEQNLSASGTSNMQPVNMFATQRNTSSFPPKLQLPSQMPALSKSVTDQNASASGTSNIVPVPNVFATQTDRGNQPSLPPKLKLPSQMPSAPPIVSTPPRVTRVPLTVDPPVADVEDDVEDDSWLRELELLSRQCKK